MSIVDDLLSASQQAVNSASSSNGEDSPPVSFVSNVNAALSAIPVIPDIGINDTTLNTITRDDSDNVGKVLGYKIQNGDDFLKAISTASNYLKANKLISGKVATDLELQNAFTAAANKQANSSQLVKAMAANIYAAQTTTTEPSNEGYVVDGYLDYTDVAFNTLTQEDKNKVITKSVKTIKEEMKRSINLEWSSYELAKDLNDVVGEKNVKQMLIELEPGDYPAKTTPDGISLKKIFGVTDNNNLISAFYSLVSTICPDPTPIDYIDYRSEKDLFDLVIEISARLSISDLINQLLNCPEVMKYLDDRTKKILRREAKLAAGRGDIYIYKTIMDLLSAAEMDSVKEDLIVLNANMISNEEKIKLFEELLKSAFLTINDLINHYTGQAPPYADYAVADETIIEDDTQPYPAEADYAVADETVIDNEQDHVPEADYAVADETIIEQDSEKDEFFDTADIEDITVMDGPTVVLMSSSNTKIIDNAIGTSTRKLVQAAVAAYA